MIRIQLVLVLLYSVELIILASSLPFAYHYNLNYTDGRFKNQPSLIDSHVVKAQEAVGSMSYHWNYEDSASWSQIYHSCNGHYQSPINIDPAKAIAVKYPKIIFGNYDLTWPSMTITNDGHTVLLDLGLPYHYPANMLPFIRAGGLVDRFNFVQVHFHWGGHSTRGSEHFIQSKQYSGELHFVHYNSKYGSLAEASKHKDGMAVIAILWQSGSSENYALQQIVDRLADISKGGQTTRLPRGIALQDLLPTKMEKFYRYTGSLTTPTCQEVVSWTVFETPIVVSEHQLNNFRQLFDKKGRSLNDNFRPIQADGGRMITYRSGNDLSLDPSLDLSLDPLFDPSLDLSIDLSIDPSLDPSIDPSFNLKKYRVTSSSRVQQLQSWEQALDFFKHSAFNSQEFFKWQPFKQVNQSFTNWSANQIK